jgi:hypothetical protein
MQARNAARPALRRNTPLQHRGCCTFAVSNGATAKGCPMAWTVNEGKLHLNYWEAVRENWRSNVPGNVAAANGNWPKVLEQAPDSMRKKGPVSGASFELAAIRPTSSSRLPRRSLRNQRRPHRRSTHPWQHPPQRPPRPALTGPHTWPVRASSTHPSALASWP